MARSLFSMVSYRIKRVIAWVLAIFFLGLVAFGGYHLLVEVL